MNPKVLLTVIILALLSGAFLWYGSKRESAGYTAGQSSQLQIDKTQFEATLKQYQATLDSAQKTIDASQASLAALDSQYHILLSSQAAIKQQVAALPAQQVQADLESKAKGSLTDPETLRKIDAIFSDYPIQVAAVANLTQQVNDLGTEVTALTKQRDTAITFGNELEGYYVKAYNAAQPHHSWFIKIITLGLVHDRHLSLPAPETLKPLGK